MAIGLLGDKVFAWNRLYLYSKACEWCTITGKTWEWEPHRLACGSSQLCRIKRLSSWNNDIFFCWKNVQKKNQMRILEITFLNQVTLIVSWRDRLTTPDNAGDFFLDTLLNKWPIGAVKKLPGQKNRPDREVCAIFWYN